jgi:hypothetical protein
VFLKVRSPVEPITAPATADRPSSADLRAVVAEATDHLEISQSDRDWLVELAECVAHEMTQAISQPDWSATSESLRLPRISRSVCRTVVRKVCQGASTLAWMQYLESLPVPAHRSIQSLSIRAILCSQDLLIRALDEHAEHSASSVSALKAQVLEGLARGDAVDELAKRCNIRLASEYVVAALSPRSAGTSKIEGLKTRSDAFVMMHNEQVVVLLPAVEGTRRKEARELVERSLCGASATAGPAITLAMAPSRAHIPAAIEEACTVLRLVETLGCPAAVYDTEDLPLEMALLRSPDLAMMLSERLIPLLNSGAPLANTLRVYLEHSQDRRQAARALHIHPNSLDYRLRRIQELTGLAPTVPRDMQTLGAALTAWRLTGR